MTDDRTRNVPDDQYRDDDGLGLIDDDPAHREERPRRKGRPGCILALIFAVILLVPLAIVGFYGGTAINAVLNIDKDSTLNPVEYDGRPQANQPVKAEHAPVNFVLMGSDKRSEDYVGRSDSLMLAQLSGDRQHLYIISFPRDMWVDIPGHGKGKINWAYSYGGAALTVRTLEQLTGVRIDHTVAIDFEGFIKLTDALGGVTVYNPWTSEQNAGMRFEKGEITISGERALAYVRERYQLPNGDLDRAYRQRTVVKAIIQKTVTRDVLTDPGKFTQVVNTFSDAMTVDDSLDVGTVAGLAAELKLDRADGVRMLQAPIAGFGTVGDQSVDVVDVDALADLSRSLQEDDMESYYAEHANPRYDRYPDVEVDEDR